MKKSALLIAAVGLALGSVHAQTVPLFVNYQGKITDGNNAPLGSSGTAPNFVAAPINRKIIFRVFDAPAGGTRLWSEQQTVTVSLGEFSVLLGQGTDAVYESVTESRPPLDTVFTVGGAVSPAGPTRFLEIVVDDGNGTFTAAVDLPIAPRQRITTTAYSFRARVADTVPNLAISTPALTDGAVTSAKLGDNQVTTIKIADGAIQNADLADSLVNTNKIADGSIAAVDLGNGSVTTAKLDAGIGVWTATAGNVSRPTGNVGIGKQPAVALDVVGTITATGPVNAASINSAGAVTAGSISTSGPFAATTITANAGLLIPGNNVLELGAGVAGKEVNAGKIGYAPFTAGALDIVGAGTTGANRKVKIWAEGGAEINGNLGLGTFSPADKVHLAGGALRIDNNAGRFVRMYRTTDGLIIEGNQTFHVGGTSTILWNGDGNWDQISDRVFKTDITDAEPVLERLMQLPVRRFRWKDRPSGAPKSFGVIAQEVKPLFPHLVGSMLREGATERNLTVKYGDFGLIAAKAVQELKQETDAEVKALREENTRLRDRLAALEANDKARDARLADIEKLILSAGKPALRAVSLRAAK